MEAKSSCVDIDTLRELTKKLYLHLIEHPDFENIFTFREKVSLLDAAFASASEFLFSHYKFVSDSWLKVFCACHAEKGESSSCTSCSKRPKA